MKKIISIILRLLISIFASCLIISFFTYSSTYYLSSSSTSYNINILIVLIAVAILSTIIFKLVHLNLDSK